jgi:hypothetical protein
LEIILFCLFRSSQQKGEAQNDAAIQRLKEHIQSIGGLSSNTPVMPSNTTPLPLHKTINNLNTHQTPTQKLTQKIPQPKSKVETLDSYPKLKKLTAEKRKELLGKKSQFDDVVANKESEERFDHLRVCTLFFDNRVLFLFLSL